MVVRGDKLPLAGCGMVLVGDKYFLLERFNQKLEMLLEI
jgi:hypothetical protein